MFFDSNPKNTNAFESDPKNTINKIYLKDKKYDKIETAERKVKKNENINNRRRTKIAEVIASRLKKENYVVDTYKDGEEGLDNALTNIYDLIILDVMLPKINRFEILKEIKRLQSLLKCQ